METIYTITGIKSKQSMSFIFDFKGDLMGFRYHFNPMHIQLDYIEKLNIKKEEQISVFKEADFFIDKKEQESFQDIPSTKEFELLKAEHVDLRRGVRGIIHEDGYGLIACF